MRYMQLMSVDGNDTIPTEPLGRPQRALDEEAYKARQQEAVEKAKAARNSVFEKGRHDLTEPKKTPIDGTVKGAEFYMGNYWFLGEPPVPRTCLPQNGVPSSSSIEIALPNLFTGKSGSRTGCSGSPLVL